MAEGETTFVFKANTKPAEDSLDEFGNKVIKVGAKSGDSLSSAFSGLGSSMIIANQAMELFGKLARAAEGAMNFAKSGEEIEAISVRFGMLADQAGLVPKKLTAGIESAIDGTVQLDDAMKAAQKSIIELGTNGERIPAIFELARKSVQLFGGDVNERFQQISQAIATGATRSLRDMGLIIDSTKAYEKYANHVGITADKLSEAQKQQAIMNEVLDKGLKKFKDVDGSITSIAENAKRASVSISEIGNTVSIVFNKYFGEMISNSLAKLSSGLIEMKRSLEVTFLGSAFTPEEQIKKLNNELIRLKELQVLNPNTAQQYLERISEITQKLTELNGQKIISSEQESKDINNAALAKASYDALGDSINYASIELLKLREAQGEWEVVAKKMEANARSLGATVSQAFAQSISKSVQFMVKNLMDGKNAFGGFITLVANLIGDLAIQLGTMFIATGIAIESLKSLSGFAAIAAGIGLVAVGTILKSLAGGGGESAAGGGGGTVGAGGTTGGSIFDVQTPEEERAKAETGVQIVVQGNIFDSKETGLQIANILNESFDTNGTIVRAFA